MENRIYDEKSGLWYEKQGDYYIPCLSLPEQENKPIGIWGQRHANYLKSYEKSHYTTLLTTGKLNSYLHDIDIQAAEMYNTLVKQLAENQGITEEVKADDMLAWVGAMNNIANQARELVYSEIIYK